MSDLMISPEFRAVTLDSCTVERIVGLRQAGQPVTLRVVMEVLELADRGRALIWAHNDRGDGGARLSCCRLTAGQWMEAALLMQDDLRPAYEVAFDILDELPDGRWAIKRRPSQVRLTTLGPVQPEEELHKLLAASRH